MFRISSLSNYLFSCCLTLAILYAPAISLGASAYISDQTPVPLREEQSTESTVIHSGLPSGTQINILTLSEDKKWCLIRTTDGIKGWIPANSVQKTPPTQQQLAQNDPTLVRNETQSISTTSPDIQLADLLKQHKELQQNHDKTVAELDHLKKLSTEAIRIEQANRDLNKTNQQLTLEMEQLTAEKSTLKSDNFNKGLQYGAGILLGGFVLGYTIKSRNSRRERW